MILEKVMFNVNGMSIQLFSKPKIITYNKNKLVCEFIFSDEWTETKTAIFTVDGTSYHKILENDKCYVPEECFFGANNQFSVGVFCGDLITTNCSMVGIAKSCYDDNTKPSVPTENVYSQLVALYDATNERIDNIAGPTDEQIQLAVNNYLSMHPIEPSNMSSSSFLFYVNGGQNPNWNPTDTKTCFKVSQTNIWNYVPMVLGGYLVTDNSHSNDYYFEPTPDGFGMKLKSDIVDKISRIETASSFFAQGQTWSNISLRCMVCDETATDADRQTAYTYLNNKVAVLFHDDIIASNSQRNKTIAGVPVLNATVNINGVNTNMLRNNATIYLDMLADNTNDYISDASYIIVTFVDRV